ncbi:MAG: hypothetical protein HQM09_00955 [Candidatus Riflebacteria bacterium]|nr:hypothetical protein [Candidatus Riflebacteria bacterium]
MADEREKQAPHWFDPDVIDAAIRRAVREALADHKRAGNPVAVWQDGRVVIVPPHKIPDFDQEPDPTPNHE